MSGVKITPEGKPDAKGLLRWDLNLGAKQSKEFHVGYAAECPGDLRVRQAASAAASTAAPALDLNEQIEALERKF